MPEKSIEDRVAELISYQTGATRSQITTDARLVEDLGCDSLDTLELIMEAEEVFHISEIPDEKAEKVKTVGEAIELIKSLIG